MVRRIESFDLTEEILKKNGIKYTMSSNSYLFDVVDGVKLINFCERNGIGVLGIEGFIPSGKYIVPSLEHIFDGSNAFESMTPCEFVITSTRGAKKFLEYAADDQMVFEFELVI